MLKSNNKKSRKQRSDKFPLTLHPTGQFCKKIKGKLYYFGNERQAAYQKYLEQASYIHLNEGKSSSIENNLSIKTLCNLCLDYYESRVTSGEIKPRQFYDQTRLLKVFVKYCGSNTPIAEITTFQLQMYRKKMVKDKKSSNTINNHISAVKAMFNWAQNNEIIASIPNLKAIKKIASSKTDKQIFSETETKKLLGSANDNMKAMILLGLNCGFGCTDCSELMWKNVDFEHGRIHFARTKTGVNRNLPLWQETVDSLKKLPVVNDFVFITGQGNKYVRVDKKMQSDGSVKMLHYNSISSEFSRLLKETGLKTEKGVGFYTLRRTAATLAARSGDPFAVQRLLGHADLKMASVYVQDVSEQTDRVINNIRKLIIPDGSLPSAEDSADTTEKVSDAET
jgi:integrase